MWYGVALNTCTRVLIDSLIDKTGNAASSAGSQGLVQISAQNEDVTVSNCVFYVCDTGVRIQSSKHINVIGNTFHNGGVEIGNKVSTAGVCSEDIVVSNNEILDAAVVLVLFNTTGVKNMGYGNVGIDAVIISGNHFRTKDKDTTLIVLEQSGISNANTYIGNVTIEGNQMIMEASSTYPAITGMLTNGAVEQLTIQSNTIVGSGKTSVQLISCFRSIIEGNQIYDYLTPTTDTGDKRYWVSSKSSSTFTITINSSYGSDITFDWRAMVGEGNQRGSISLSSRDLQFDAGPGCCFE